MTSSSRAKRRTTSWRASLRALGPLAAACLPALAAAAWAAESGDQTEGGCVRVVRQEAVVEGASLRVRGELMNTCGYILRNVRIQVEARDQNGQTLGTGEAFVDPAVLGIQEAARFDVPIATTVQPAAVHIMTTWRRGLGY